MIKDVFEIRPLGNAYQVVRHRIALMGEDEHQYFVSKSLEKCQEFIKNKYSKETKHD